MALNSTDEKFIVELYRHYQLSRDTINQTALFGIKNSAKTYLDELDSIEPVSEYGRTVIAQIRDQAHQRYLMPLQDASTQGNNNGFFTKSKKAVNRWLNNLTKPVWAGAAITAALLVAIVVNVFGPQSTVPTDISQSFSSTALNHNADFVAAEVMTEIDWQYGFSQQDISQREAFISGVYAVDLINLDQSVNIQKIAKQLSTMELTEDDQTIQSLMKTILVSEPDRETIISLFAALSDFYQTQPTTELFEFGRWLEFNYLHAKLALALNDLSLYSEYRKPGESILARFISSGKAPGVIKQDLNELKLLFAEAQFDNKNVAQQARLLEKIRTLLF